MADELTATIPDPEMAKLEALAIQHDTEAAQELGAPEPEPAPPAAEKVEHEGEINPDSSETDPDKAKERPRDALGRFTKTEDGKDIPEADRKPAEAPVEAEKSDFEKAKQAKAKKEQERQDRSWEALNRQKDELAARTAALEAEKQRLAQQQQPQRLAQQEQRQFSSRELAEAAKDFKARAKQALDAGDYDAFNENNALAEQAEEHARQFYQIELKEAQQVQLQKYNETWRGHWQATVEKEPDVAKPGTALSKEVQSLLESHGQLFWMIPDGFPKAVEIAKLRMEAGSASELREKLTKAEEKLKRYEKATTPLGAGPTTPIQSRKLDDLSTDEQMNELERMAARADAEALSA